MRSLSTILLVTSFAVIHVLIAQHANKVKRAPNILFAIADDQSYPHAGAYGQEAFQTPVIDSIARNGILFSNAFVAAPQCSPSRAAILTGKQIWQLEEAGTHSSYFPKKFPVFTNALEKGGYFIGYTGKPWAPGNWKDAGWERNPVGPEFNKRQLVKAPTTGINKNDYAANFKDFLTERPANKPFFFWFGSQEPHRVYEEGSGLAAGMNAGKLLVPPFLPANDLVKSDMLDYAYEIKWFDTQLGKMLQLLKEAGELDNTIVVVTADNGMAFPYAKANMQEYGIHVPLVMSGPAIKGKNRKVNDLISMIDLAPTFLEIAGQPALKGISGRSMMNILNSNASGTIDPSRNRIYAGRERHSHARPDNLGYPSRVIRSAQYLYIENFKPDRWPLGDPAPLTKTPIAPKSGMKPIMEGYEDIDDSPTKSFMIKQQFELPELFHLGFEKRNVDELYDIKKDPYCMYDLSMKSSFASIKKQLKAELNKVLAEQGDPRVTGKRDLFDSYPRFGLMRPFDGFKEGGKYNPAYSIK